MSRKKIKWDIEQYDHADKERVNNPHVGLVSEATEPTTEERKKYEYDPHLDPPYGIKYGSNFQPFVNKKTDTSSDKDTDLTAEPEMIKAFWDTWELGIHSYLSYLRDRLLLARELLHESGSVFVQIGDENVHRVGLLLYEVFGADNRMATISFATTSGSSTNLVFVNFLN